MLIRVLQVETDEYRSYVGELFWEYLNYSNLKFSREFGISFDVNKFWEQDMAKLYQFTPPEGRLLLGEYDAQIAGCACLRKINQDVGEIKRMYVRPGFQRKGIGRSLLTAIINQAVQIGYFKICLDTAPYAKEAQMLYRSVGFRDIKSYDGNSEIPLEYQANWVFMELILNEYSL
ncbi:MAG: GNAT family N-acetyltransferase [Desmonostoc vinosum HA7617-LM4]|jgi:GNAT superfamily N-acetyltransferase|nr:GNAT family N-acetyltransferase [Desmonostoc vinosum HA7617-LM4]